MQLRIKIITAVAAVAVLVGAGWIWFYTPTPVQQLLPADAAIQLDGFDGSAPPDAGTPSVLILGSPHLSQEEHGYTQEEFDEVVESLSAYRPDMVVVEYLPPSWPPGEGRDYRPRFDLESYAQAWDLEPDAAEVIVDAQGQGETPAEPCRLGKAYFLGRDFINAHYHWRTHDCPHVQRDEEIDSWLAEQAGSESAEIAFPVAHAAGVDRLIPFDYQGDDAQWFIGRKARELLRSGQLGAVQDYSPVVPVVGATSRELQAHARPHRDSLSGILHYSNSPEHIGVQYWAYEVALRSIDHDNAGDRQAENYWLRNERMFGYLEQAVAEQSPERVLVIVGSGHKYFLDALVQESDYRWIDPREWLPAPE